MRGIDRFERAQGKLLQALREHPSPALLRFATYVQTLDYSPNQPRDKNGKWTNGGQSGTMGKTKYAPSAQRSKGGIQLSPKTYARLTGTFNTRFPELEAGEIRKIRDAGYKYTVEADGYGGFKTLSRKKI